MRVRAKHGGREVRAIERLESSGVAPIRGLVGAGVSAPFEPPDRHAVREKEQRGGGGPVEETMQRAGLGHEDADHERQRGELTCDAEQFHSARFAHVDDFVRRDRFELLVVEHVERPPREEHPAEDGKRGCVGSTSLELERARRRTLEPARGAPDRFFEALRRR